MDRLDLEKTIIMKKINLILLSVFFTISLTSLGYIQYQSVSEYNNSEPQCAAHKFEFQYHIGPRFGSKILKEDLDKAEFITDVFPSCSNGKTKTYKDVKYFKFDEDDKPVLMSQSSESKLDDSQLAMFRSMESGESYSIQGKVSWMDEDSDLDIIDTLLCYVTVVPVQAAVYSEGMEAVIGYLRENSAEDVANVEEEKVDPGKISFVISKDGQLKNIDNDFSCGYKKVDKRMVKLLSNLPGKWIPARNAKGLDIDQQLTLFYGKMGC